MDSLWLPFWSNMYVCICFSGGSAVKDLPVDAEMWVQSLGQEDPLEEEMAAHYSILAWKIPRTEETCGLQSIVSQRVGQDSVTEHICKGIQMCPFNKTLLWGDNPGVSMTLRPDWWHMWILRKIGLNSLLVFLAKFLIGFWAKKKL